MRDLSGMFARLGQENATVTRYSAGSTTRGVYTAGSTSTLTLPVHRQPVSGIELARFEEGDRNRQRWVLFSVAELKTANEVAKTKADEVSLDGLIFEVESVEAWQQGYYRVIVVLQNRQKDA